MILIKERHIGAFLFVVFFFIIFAFFFAVMGFGATDSHLSSNKHLTFFFLVVQNAKFWLQMALETSVHIRIFVVLPKERPKDGGMFVFFSFSHWNDQKPVQLRRCRELSRKWLVCDTKVRGVTCVSVGRYYWKTFAFTVLCPQNHVVTFHPILSTGLRWIDSSSLRFLLFCGFFVSWWATLFTFYCLILPKYI